MNLDAMGDSWEELVSTGIVLAQNLDAGRWALGDLAGTVEGRYGTDALGNFASEIGMARKSTLKGYRRVSARFEKDVRATFSESLSWSHFQAAMRAKDDAELWLARAADEGWPVAELGKRIAAAIGKPVPPVKVWEGRGMIRFTVNGDVYLIPEAHAPELDACAAGQIVTIKVYEVAE